MPHPTLEELDVVQLTRDCKGQKTGDVGTIVHIQVPGEIFMVEFADEDGRLIAFLDCPRDALTPYAH